MGMSRLQAATYLSTEAGLESLINESGRKSTDTADGYKPAIDQALRRLGASESGLATAEIADSQIPAYIALMEYYALRLFARTIATRVDYQATSLEADRDAVFQHVRQLMEQAAEAAEAYGYSIDGDSAWSLGRLTLDYIEPEPAA